MTIHELYAYAFNLFTKRYTLRSKVTRKAGALRSNVV